MCSTTSHICVYNPLHTLTTPRDYLEAHKALNGLVKVGCLSFIQNRHLDYILGYIKRVEGREKREKITPFVLNAHRLTGAG